jgi:hypothetical protein
VSVRVYLATSFAGLRSVVRSDGVGPSPFLAHAVTDAVRDELSDGGDEEWEYAASTAAAQSAVGLLLEDDVPRRVVVALDVASVRRVGSDDPTLVEVDEVVPMRRVAAVLADDATAEGDVAAARDALAAGAPDRDRLLERCLDHELAWWAAQEISQLLDQTTAG